MLAQGSTHPIRPLYSEQVTLLMLHLHILIRTEKHMGALPAGFFRGAGYFFTFYLICISSMIQMSAVYRLLAAASPNMDIASATGACLQS